MCPHGYDHLTISNNCVKLFTWPGNYLSWHDSLTACQNDGGDLPILDPDSFYNEFIHYMDNVIVAS